MTVKTLLWVLWAGASGALACWLAVRLHDGEADRTVFLPGATTSGHHQIEMACGACHTAAYADRDAMQLACEGCHAAALDAAKDDHPKSKFTDPRNAERVAVLDARYCVTCHVEHRPAATSAMGLTVPQDYCHLCHHDIAEDRPSHAGMAFDSCASAGCHNFHDNRALYEDFLARHLGGPDTMRSETLVQSNFLEIAQLLEHYPQHPFVALTQSDADAPGDAVDEEVLSDWLASSHATAGVNCSACHLDDDGTWRDEADHAACRGCHVDEVDTFLAGKHGMRLDVARLGRALAPMTAAEARLPMRKAAADRKLGCTSCHGAHGFDAGVAAVDACLGCHADTHSLAYEGSPHDVLRQAELAGALPAGSGVSCATCHMPRVEKDHMWGAFTQYLVDHNNSATLQPNEKMIRPVCLNCHGLRFTIDALADRMLIDRNFTGRPAVHVESMDLAEKRR